MQEQLLTACQWTREVARTWEFNMENRKEKAGILRRFQRKGVRIIFLLIIFKKAQCLNGCIKRFHSSVFGDHPLHQTNFPEGRTETNVKLRQQSQLLGQRSKNSKKWPGPLDITEVRGRYPIVFSTPMFITPFFLQAFFIVPRSNQVSATLSHLQLQQKTVID